MVPKVSEVVAILEKLAPPALAEDWDNVGLAVGDPAWPVKKIWIALDPLARVAELAKADGANLLVTHHPLFFRPVSSLDLSTPEGRVVEAAVSGKMAVYCAHTNLDSVAGGVNDILARRLGLENTQALVPADGAPDADPQGAVAGMGRVGDLPRDMSLKDLAALAKERLGLAHLRMVGDPEMSFRRVALCGGAGGSLLGRFLGCGARVFITGDLKYHEARAIADLGLGALDVGHFASEQPVVEVLAKLLSQALSAHGYQASVSAFGREADPFVFV